MTVLDNISGCFDNFTKIIDTKYYHIAIIVILIIFVTIGLFFFPRLKSYYTLDDIGDDVKKEIDDIIEPNTFIELKESIMDYVKKNNITKKHKVNDDDLSILDDIIETQDIYIYVIGCNSTIEQKCIKENTKEKCNKLCVMIPITCTKSQAGIICNNENKLFAEGSPIVFDRNVAHSYYNNSTYIPAVILVIYI